MNDTRRFAVAGLIGALVGGALVAGAFLLPAPMDVEESSGPTDDVVETERQAYWFSRYNVNAMLLMTGVGERLVPPEGMPQMLADVAEFDLSQMPKNPYLLRRSTRPVTLTSSRRRTSPTCRPSTGTAPR